MIDRVKALWLPGLATFALSVTSHWALRGVRSWRGGVIGFKLWGNLAVYLYLDCLYLLALAFIGAIGAYWSFRAGGRPRHRVLAALFPAFWQLIVLASLTRRASPLGRMTLSSVVISAFLDRAVIPGLALLLGALAFLGRARRQAPSG